MCLSYADAGFLALPFAIKESLASISTIAAAHFFLLELGRADADRMPFHDGLGHAQWIGMSITYVYAHVHLH